MSDSAISYAMLETLVERIQARAGCFPWPPPDNPYGGGGWTVTAVSTDCGTLTLADGASWQEPTCPVGTGSPPNADAILVVDPDDPYTHIRSTVDLANLLGTLTPYTISVNGQTILNAITSGFILNSGALVGAIVYLVYPSGVGMWSRVTATAQTVDGRIPAKPNETITYQSVNDSASGALSGGTFGFLQDLDAPEDWSKDPNRVSVLAWPNNYFGTGQQCMVFDANGSLHRVPISANDGHNLYFGLTPGTISGGLTLNVVVLNGGSPITTQPVMVVLQQAGTSDVQFTSTGGTASFSVETSNSYTVEVLSAGFSLTTQAINTGGGTQTNVQVNVSSSTAGPVAISSPYGIVPTGGKFYPGRPPSNSLLFYGGITQDETGVTLDGDESTDVIGSATSDTIPAAGYYGCTTTTVQTMDWDWPAIGCTCPSQGSTPQLFSTLHGLQAFELQTLAPEYVDPTWAGGTATIWNLYPAYLLYLMQPNTLAWLCTATMSTSGGVTVNGYGGGDGPVYVAEVPPPNVDPLQAMSGTTSLISEYDPTEGNQPAAAMSGTTLENYSLPDSTNTYTLYLSGGPTRKYTQRFMHYFGVLFHAPVKGDMTGLGVYFGSNPSTATFVYDAYGATEDNNGVVFANGMTARYTGDRNGDGFDGYNGGDYYNSQWIEGGYEGNYTPDSESTLAAQRVGTGQYLTGNSLTAFGNEFNRGPWGSGNNRLQGGTATGGSATQLIDSSAVSLPAWTTIASQDRFSGFINGNTSPMCPYEGFVVWIASGGFPTGMFSASGGNVGGLNAQTNVYTLAGTLAALGTLTFSLGDPATPSTTLATASLVNTGTASMSAVNVAAAIAAAWNDIDPLTTWMSATSSFAGAAGTLTLNGANAGWPVFVSTAVGTTGLSVSLNSGGSSPCTSFHKAVVIGGGAAGTLNLASIGVSVASGDQYVIPEPSPKVSFHRLETAVFTPSNSTETFAAIVTAHDSQTLFFGTGTFAGTLTSGVNTGTFDLGFDLSRIRAGSCLKFNGTGWALPTGGNNSAAFVTTGSTDPTNPAAVYYSNEPDLVQTQGLIHRGDIAGEWLLDEMNAALALIYKQTTGINWVATPSVGASPVNTYGEGFFPGDPSTQCTNNPSGSPDVAAAWSGLDQTYSTSNTPPQESLNPYICIQWEGDCDCVQGLSGGASVQCAYPMATSDQCSPYLAGAGVTFWGHMVQATTSFCFDGYGGAAPYDASFFGGTNTISFFAIGTATTDGTGNAIGQLIGSVVPPAPPEDFSDFCPSGTGQQAVAAVMDSNAFALIEYSFP